MPPRIFDILPGVNIITGENKIIRGGVLFCQSALGHSHKLPPRINCFKNNCSGRNAFRLSRRGQSAAPNICPERVGIEFLYRKRVFFHLPLPGGLPGGSRGSREGGKGGQGGTRTRD